MSQRCCVVECRVNTVDLFVLSLAHYSPLAGVNKVIVAVNQLDAVDWSEARYREMCTRLESFFASLQCRDLYYVPTSGFLGLNLERRPTADEAPALCAWYAAALGVLLVLTRTVATCKSVPHLQRYNGPCLLEVIDSLPLLPRTEAAAKPLRFCVHDVFKPGVGTAGASVSVAGYMDAGTLVPGALDCCALFTLV